VLHFGADETVMVTESLEEIADLLDSEMGAEDFDEDEEEEED